MTARDWLEELRRKPLCSIPEGARAADVSINRMRRAIAQGDVEVVRLGKQRLIKTKSFLQKIGEG